MLVAAEELVQDKSAPPRPASSWAARGFVLLLFLATGGVAAHLLLQKAPPDVAPFGPSPSVTSRTEKLDQTPFRLPELTDQHPRDSDSSAASPRALVDSLDPLAPRDRPPRDPPLERSEVLRVAGTDGTDAGGPAPSEGAARASEPAQADAEPPLPLAETIPFAEPPPEAQPPEAVAPGENCGFITCATGFGCCNPSCGVCVAPGENCDPTPCESKVQYPVSEVCGRSVCSAGRVCCNPSCGTCVSPGERCDPAPCDRSIQYPVSPMCGRNTCSAGKECCNPSCGICVAPGETCDQRPCR
jgi:hypothetical protein